MVSIDQLKVLIAVAESRSLSQAAERVHKTQPALTTAIKQLESQLNLSLFNRDQYRMQLNAQGQVIYQKAKQVIAEHCHLLDTATCFANGEESVITLVIEASFEIEQILPALEQVQQAFASTQIVLSQEYLSGPIEQLQESKVDLAISPLPNQLMRNNQLEYKVIGQGYLLNVAAEKLIQKFDNLTSVRQLIDTYQVVVKDSGMLTNGIKVGVQDAQRHWYVNNFATKLSLIQSGMGWGRLPEHFVREALAKQQLKELKLSDYDSRIEMHYGLIKIANKPLGPVASAIWKAL
ncbi:LysR family transcriptional regulator [Marinomonas posidonica]|uniref:LysR family transcriptional regulator n=1 Tax=Marinomonas posidonica TaxID=936476 RepID=UPI00373643EA